MAKIVTIKTEEPVKRKRRVPDVTDEQREKRLCDLALTRVEERMRNGEATAMEYSHFLKLAAERNRMEQEELRCKIELLKAKAEAIKTAEQSSLDYAAVLKAMTHYGSTVIASSEEDVSDII